MECIEARALKASFLSQMATKKSNSQVYCNDDVWCFTGIKAAAAAAEEFHVEDLLNLDITDDGGFYEEDKCVNKHGCKNNSASTFSGADEFDNISAGEFNDAVEGLESLEWLSQFVEDSSPALSLLCPTVSFMVEDSVNYSPEKAQTTFVDTEVPRKRRSKRPRTNNVLPWALVSPRLSSADSSSSSSHGSSSLPVFVFPHPAPDIDWFSSAEKSSPPPEKKQKRRPENESSGRRCTHCLVKQTPQWRTGPLGPKTLCNACGVRFKSGRLFAEYRPACSPTFSPEVHSNSHRKVLELRRRKDMATTTTPTAVDEHGGYVSPVVNVGG